MADYPDGTYPVDIIAQSLATVAIDIAAQTLATLGVNIKAQDLANLKVDVAAQTLSELGVNITAQDLAELVIKIAAQSVGVYVERDWAATQDEDKSLTGTAKVYDTSSEDVVSYTVPAGKTLYIDDISFSIDFKSATMRQECILEIAGAEVWRMYLTTDTPIIEKLFTTPRKANAGESVILRVYNSDTAYITYVTANLTGREYSV